MLQLSNKTILLTRHDKIGDFITALPMAKVLKEQTQCKIVFLLSKINLPLAQHLHFIDEIIVWEDDTFKMVQKIKQANIDISISAYIDNKLGLSLWLSNIKTRIAPKTKIAQIFFNKTIKQRRSKVEKTEWQYNLELLKLLNHNISLDFTPPLLTINQNHKLDFIIFHPGFGGSSDGNLNYDDYLKLINVSSKYIDVVLTFGPDDQDAKEFFRSKIDKNIKIIDNFNNIWDFTKFIATSQLFVSTSTGPMHLAGLTNTKTLSFFGSNLFATPKRWATISDIKYQHNFIIPPNYDNKLFQKIEQTLLNIINTRSGDGG